MRLQLLLYTACAWFYILGFTDACHAQFVTEAERKAEWAEVRKQQPPELELKLTLPKTTFYRGEAIRGELTFTNTSKTIPYHMWAGTYDRSGRIEDIIYRAQDAEGKNVADPLDRNTFSFGGIGRFQNLGWWSITLPANEWLLLDKPGIYTLYVISWRVKAGTGGLGNNDGKYVPLVSDKVKITIEPLLPAREKKVIEDAVARMSLKERGGPAPATKEALEDLRFLDTPASRQVLIGLLKKDSSAVDNASFYADFGLRSTADPKAAVAEILAAVADKRLTLAEAEAPYISLAMRTTELPPRPATYNDATKEAWEKWNKANETARARVIAKLNEVALKASGGNGPAYVEILIADFERRPQDPKARKALAPLLLKLNKEQKLRILRSWEHWGGDDFLPLARSEAAAANPVGLQALAQAKPNEARALMIEDAKRPESRFFAGDAGTSEMREVGEKMKPAPAPELDKVLLQKLQGGTTAQGSADGYSDETLFYLEQFASPALLPEIQKQYRAHLDDPDLYGTNTLLRVWMRQDPKGALEALAGTIRVRTETNAWYRTRLKEVLGTAWTDKAIPLLITCLDDKDPSVVVCAVNLLAQHGDVALVDKCIAALERVYQPEFKDKDSSGGLGYSQLLEVINSARDMMEPGIFRPRWTFTDDQKKRLTHITNVQQ